MNIKSFLDSTYLKTSDQAGLSDDQNKKVVVNCIQEAIDENFKLIMIRPEMVSLARKMISDQNSKVNIGTVIDFPKGNSNYSKKINEAKQAIIDGADDLDFVCNYEEFKKGNTLLLKEEILKCTEFAIQNNKVIKWIKSNGVNDHEMLKTFNCGVGFCIIADKKNLKKILKVFNKSSKPYEIGTIIKSNNNKKIILNEKINWKY